MIINTLEHWRQYRLGAAWEKAFDFLISLAPDIATGRHVIDGSDVFAEVAEYATVPEMEKPYESHRTYMDIQYLLRGREWLDYAPIRTLRVRQDYDSQRDFMLYERPALPVNRLMLGSGMFAALYPEDGHSPGIACGGMPENVKKVVVKIRVSLLEGR